MLKKSFEQTIRELCEAVLSEPKPDALPEKIINHVQTTFPVQWSTLWLTEQKGTTNQKRLCLAAAGGVANKLLSAEDGGSAVYDFGEGLTGEIAQQASSLNITSYDEFNKHQHAKKYDSVMYEPGSAKNQCRCVLGVPLMLKSTAKVNPEWRVIGVLKLENIEASEEHPQAYFTDEDVRIVEAYAAVIAVALEKAQMRADSIRIGAGLLDVSKSLLAELGGEPNLEEFVKQTANVISAEACSVWIRSGLQLRLRAAYGYSYDAINDTLPTYQLEPEADEKCERGKAANGINEKVGLTVYVASSATILNIQSADEISGHFAWEGEKDEIMWRNKPRGTACYSLVAIPLIDNETKDLRGVFKIENKRPTLFQLESFFTKEDEQLLKILGNSISSSLIISERIDRLRRLERLVGDVRVLDNLDEALFFVLTGLTHRDGLQYNRTMIYLIDEEKPTQLVCRFAIGQIEPQMWQKEVGCVDEEPPLDLDKQLKDFRSNQEKYLTNPMMLQWKGREIKIGDPCHEISKLADSFDSGQTQEPKVFKGLSGEIKNSDMLYGFSHGDFVLIPITFEKKLKGIIYADNRFTGNRVNQFECAMLDLFSGMAGAVIQASGVPGKLKAERDQAWKTFSGPAAHRLGTETTIIKNELELYINPELENSTQNSDGRILVHRNVIENSVKVILQAVSRLRLAVKDYQRLAFDVEEQVDFDLCDLVEQTIQNTTSAMKGIKASADFSEKSLWVYAAPCGITYVFEELLINAWKEVQSDDDVAFPEKSSEIQVQITVTRDENSAICTVSDDGYGIPEELLKNLFKTPRSGRKGGTGLGLYIVKTILDQNNAKIELHSTQKSSQYHGACFKITIPLSSSQRLPRSAVGVKTNPEILIVEDNPIFRKHLFKVLTDSGFSCELAQNESEAKARMTSTLRIIVADIDLSEAGGSLKGGIDLAENLKDKKIPIILISANPWYYLPGKDSPKYKAMQDECSIVSVLDRNISDFFGELVTTIKEVTSKCPK